MFEAIALEQSLSPEAYRQAVKPLRLQLLERQFALVGGERPVIIVLAGDDRSGRHETLNALCTWMDPRFLRANAYGPASYTDAQYPFFWRYWRDLPGQGELAVYIRDWTSASIVQYLNGEIDAGKLERRIRFINAFEQALVDAGAIMVKCWLHLPRERLAERLAEQHNSVFVDPKDELAYANYDQAQRTIEQVLRRTAAYQRSWHLIDGSDTLQRNITVGEILATALTPPEHRETAWPPDNTWLATETTTPVTVLDRLDLSLSLDKATYAARLETLQAELRHALYESHAAGIPVVIVFEGWDAAGKGGVIRRLVASLDAGYYHIVPVAKPTEEEAAHHYLWRFWRQLPAKGQMIIFDRSWYGRVLVERVEGLCSEAAWQRAYREINDFEEQLVVHGTLLKKFWLHIDADEQAARFQAREQSPYKRFKITSEDYRNREQRGAYALAVQDMVTQTSTDYARWELIPANSKRYARITVLESVLETVTASLASRAG